MQSPEAGEEKPRHQYKLGPLKQLGRKGAGEVWDLDQRECEPPTCARGKDSQLHPGLHEAKCQQQAEGGDPASLHSPGEATPSRNARPCSAGMGWREPAVHTRDSVLRGPGSAQWDCKRSRQTQKGPHLASVK